MTGAKIAAGVMVAQDMLYTYHLLESLKLEVELPMVLEMDNAGAVDIANSWSSRQDASCRCVQLLLVKVER